MPDLTQEALARRLQRAREQAGYTQEAAAEQLDLSRPVLAHIERGAREVTGIEIASMARLYHVRVEDLLSGDTPPIEMIIASRFRAATGMDQDPAIMATLTDLIDTCSEVSRIERELDGSHVLAALPRYEFPQPRSIGDSIRQGQEMAEQERARLRLGDQPIPDVAELLLGLGIRVWSHTLPSGTSGLFFADPRTGVVIVVNDSDLPERQVYSFAHEYCHALADKDRGVVVSMHEDKDPTERRAEIFAIHFLAPESAVRKYVASSPLYLEDDSKAELVAMAARHFGISYDAMAFHLNNLRLISKQDLEQCRVESAKREAIARVKILGGALRRGRESQPISLWVLRTCVLGLQKKKVARVKAEELCDRVGISAKKLEDALHPKTTARDESFY